MAAKRALKHACAATLIFSLLEFVGGKLTHSLALIADSAHLVSDAGALGLAFFAAWIAEQPATRKMSYGYYRFEILAALINGVALFTLSIFLFIEAFQRLVAPPRVESGWMLMLGLAGLFFNLIIAMYLQSYTQKSLNVKSAFFHVLADLLGSVGVVTAAVIIWKTGWLYADALVSMVIAALIIWGAGSVLKDVVAVLLEATPSRVDMNRLESRLLALPGVEVICDLHVWTISSGQEALSVHLGVCAGCDSKSLLQEVNAMLAKEFEIYHTTVQIEESQQKPHLPHHGGARKI